MTDRFPLPPSDLYAHTELHRRLIRMAIRHDLNWREYMDAVRYWETLFAGNRP